jgi:hypothetical protein
MRTFALDDLDSGPMSPAEGWTTAAAAASRRGAKPSPRRALVAGQTQDPDFSIVAFEDLLYGLYARVHDARGQGALGAIEPYLSPNVHPVITRRASALGALARVEGVIVGGLRFTRYTPPTPYVAFHQVSVEFDANYTEVTADGKTQTYWVVEHWRLRRAATARSRPPEAIARFGCPSCGASAGYTQGVCGYCGQAVGDGKFDWEVVAIETVRREPRAPAMGQHAEERGTQAPTITAPTLQADLAQLTAAHPNLSLPAVARRLALIHRELNAGWSAQQWSRARPFTSEALFQSQLFYIDAYRRAGLRNITEGARITRTQLVAVSADRWYQALTFRVFATGLDYTLRAADGALYSGNKSQERPFSEYWTLIRSADNDRPVTESANCPSCGAALDVNMAGECAFCGSRITTGSFDWVLSRIEQDEAYSG